MPASITQDRWQPGCVTFDMSWASAYAVKARAGIPVRVAIESTHAVATCRDGGPAGGLAVAGPVGDAVPGGPAGVVVSGASDAAAAGSMVSGTAPAITYSVDPPLRATANSTSQPRPTMTPRMATIQTTITPGTVRPGARTSHWSSSAPLTTTTIMRRMRDRRRIPTPRNGRQPALDLRVYRCVDVYRSRAKPQHRSRVFGAAGLRHRGPTPPWPEFASPTEPRRPVCR